MFFCKGNKWQASFCSSIFHCFFGRLRLNLSEYQRRGETASPSVRCLKPWSFTLKVWGIVAANQQGLATAANQLEGFICIVVCIEYPFSNCQNVGPFGGDTVWYQVVTWGFIAQLVSFECYHCASHAIFWLQADLAVCPAIFHLIRTRWLPAKRTRQGLCGPNMQHTSASGGATRFFGQSMADTDDNNMSICSVQCNM